MSPQKTNKNSIRFFNLDLLFRRTKVIQSRQSRAVATAVFHLDARPEKENQPFYRTWRMASLEITQSRGRRQTLRISKPGLSVSGNFSGSSRQVLQEFADGQTRLQQQNHLVCIDAYVRAQRQQFW
jgi:hypothetical protein